MTPRRDKRGRLVCSCGGYHFPHRRTSGACDHSSRADYGYLQHGTDGPFRTERVRVKHEYADRWLARFKGKWRRVHVQVRRTFIVYQGQKITIQIEGV